MLGIWFTAQPYTVLAASFASSAQKFISISDGGENLVVSIDHVTLSSCGTDQIGLSMSFALLGNALPRMERVYITPQLILDDQVASFPAVEILGKWAYYHDLRTPQASHFMPDALQYRDREAANLQSYHQVVERQAWMSRATLRLIVERTDGCGNTLKHIESELRTPSAVVNQQVNTQSVVVKTYDVQQLQGRAYVSYPVKVTDLQPDFHNNRKELERLSNTIDSVANDTTIEILRIQIRGYASPEGSYATNERLARLRTSSLARYIIEQTDLAPKLFRTSSVPEDWEGLRNFVDSTTLLTHRSELLEMIDSDLLPDEKLAQIASRYPDDYQVMSNVAFPQLRHTDYQIDYQLKQVKIEKGSDIPVPVDTLWQLAIDQPTDTLESIQRHYKGFKPLLAVKTNLLFDAILAPNVEIEVPFGKEDKRWSVMAEVWCPWWRFDHNAAGEQHKYYRSDQRPTRTSYQLLAVGVEARRWFAGKRCPEARPLLTGPFVGLYAAGGKYDLGRNGKGDQGEYFSVGLSAGYSWPIARHWNLELSAAVGYVGGPKVHYENEFDDARLIYRNDTHLNYVGPTKLKLSLVYLIGKKGGGL